MPLKGYPKTSLFQLGMENVASGVSENVVTCNFQFYAKSLG